MAKKEFPIHTLQDYLPNGSYEPVLEFLRLYKVHLTITRERSTVLGDYRHAVDNQHHRISVNGNLHQYSFLITLIHELAHLVTFMQFGNRVASHGREWKNLYAQLLSQFLQKKIFPADIQKAIEHSMHNLPASSCADENLQRVLRKYDESKNGFVLVEDLPDGARFMIEGGRLFKKGKKLRKRFQCTEINTRKLFLFSPVYEVKPVEVE